MTVPLLQGTVSRHPFQLRIRRDRPAFDPFNELGEPVQAVRRNTYQTVFSKNLSAQRSPLLRKTNPYQYPLKLLQHLLQGDALRHVTLLSFFSFRRLPEDSSLSRSYPDSFIPRHRGGR
jgi:hypothetical protein